MYRSVGKDQRQSARYSYLVLALDWKYVFSVHVFAPDPKYTEFQCIWRKEERIHRLVYLCICFKVRYTVYFVYFGGVFVCIFHLGCTGKLSS